MQVKRSDFTNEKNVGTSESDLKVFDSYPCAYCGFIIASMDHLQDHEIDCSGSHKPGFLKKSKTLLFSSSYQPDIKESPPQVISSLTASFSPPVELPPPKFLPIFSYQDPRLSMHLPESEQYRLGRMFIMITGTPFKSTNK